jgi:hypothetical protein
MSAKFSFLEADIDGEGKRWRLVVDAGDFLTLADEDFTLPRSEIEENGDRIFGPFSVEQLVEAVVTSRIANITGNGPHRRARSNAARRGRQ